MSEHLVELEAAWQQHVTTDMSLFERLMGRYREKHRKYHKEAHIGSVVAAVNELTENGAAHGEAPKDLGAIIAAAMYHDAIYEPASPANERASARLARRDLATFGWADDRIAAVSDMIEGTKHHLDPGNIDASILFDADLAILAAEPAKYGVYAKNVRAEYRHLDDEDWADGRPAVLEAFLGRDAIYATAAGRELWEEPARVNLAAELATFN